MKKALGIFLIMMLISGMAYAGFSVDKKVLDTTLNSTIRTANSDSVKTLGYNKIGIFIDYDDTTVGNSVFATYTLQISYDNSNWQAVSFYNATGGSTLQVSQVVSAASSYEWGYLNQNLIAPYTRVVVSGSNTDTDDLIRTKVYIVAQE